GPPPLLCAVGGPTTDTSTPMVDEPPDSWSPRAPDGRPLSSRPPKESAPFATPLRYPESATPKCRYTTKVAADEQVASLSVRPMLISDACDIKTTTCP